MKQCTCEYCQKSFSPKHHGKSPRFCCRSCSARGREPRKVNTVYSVCKNCGKRYDTQYGRRTKYCSQKCMSLSYTKENHCLACNAPISIHRKYCSLKCRLDNSRIVKVCKSCGKEFKTTPSDDRVFCSKRCAGKALANRIKYNCPICNKEMNLIPSRLKNNKVVYCSYKCRNFYIISKIKRNGCKNTSIEIKIQNELLRRKIKFTKQCRIKAIATVDIFIEPNIIIQCDGNYWHNLKDHKDRDTQQDLELMFNGYKVYRFWETDINKSAKKCIDKIFQDRPKNDEIIPTR